MRPTVEAWKAGKDHAAKRRPRSYKTIKSYSYTEQVKALIDYQMGIIKQATDSEMKTIKDAKMKMKMEMEEGEVASSPDSDESDRFAHCRRHLNKEKKKEEKNGKEQHKALGSHSRQHKQFARVSSGSHKSRRDSEKHRP